MNRAAVFAFSIFSAMFTLESYAQVGHGASAIEFIENKGQWKESIQFESGIPNGQLYIEDGKLTYVLYSGEDLDRIHEIKHNKDITASLENLNIDGHLFQVSFLSANPMTFLGNKKRSNYYNYFLGNDPEFWKGEVPAYKEVISKNVWNNIDYRLYSQDIDLKYDFIVNPGGDPSEIQLEIAFLDKLHLKNGNLHLKTSVNEMVDLKPVAYQWNEDHFVAVECKFSLKKGILGFEFPESFDKTKRLVIDPQLIFSSYSGSTRDNWGFTATFDQAGNLYGGGITFTSTNSSLTYPLTVGAFQTSFGGGAVDIGISKFNSDGTTLVYSTYLGGSKNEIPHSLVVNSQNELIVMGTASSLDYPVTAGSYDNTFNTTGILTRTVAQTVVYQGSDIVLSKFSPSGATLLGSTYIGGTSFDGVNTASLEINYGDDVRGEVVVDNSDNILVATTTSSGDFPVTNASTYGGGAQDAVVFKMNPSLTAMTWATYIGGSGVDAAYSLQMDNTGKVYVAGGTTSSNFPTTIGVINPSPLGGTDGFVAVINASGAGIFASTRLGTSAYDQAYFVQLDDSNYVYVTGQTEGQYPITPPTVYSNIFSAQFIHKMTTDLDSTVFSTVVGTGGSTSNISIDISPSAFLVNQCDHIYLSGWGGTINSSSTTGLPTTPGAFKTTTDGNDFYLIVLDRNADSLLYATFFGGTGSSGEHVDGGTSRFDKRGIVYQAVCAGCGGNNSFPTSPSNVWSSTNGSGNCNLGVIKFDLSQLTSDVGLSALSKVCVPGTVQFVNNSNGGTNYFWDFGDGDTSNLFQPTHTYMDTGNFTVMLVVSDSLSCLLTDTSYINIRGEGPPTADILPIPVICPGDSAQLIASGGVKYQWSPNSDITNDTISNPLVYPSITTLYTVIVGDSCGGDTSNYFAYDTATVLVQIAQDITSATGGDTICKGDSIQLNAAGGVAYNWSPPTYLNNPTISNPISIPSATTAYNVDITDQFGCLWTKVVTVFVEDPQNPNIYSSEDTVLCFGDSVLLFISGGGSYLWRPSNLVNDSTSDIVFARPLKSTSFKIDVINKCFIYVDTINVEVVEYEVTAMPDTFACEDVPIQLTASPGVIFNWTPEKQLLDPGNNSPKAVIDEATTFYVYAENELGCSSEDSVFIDLRDAPYINAGSDRVIRGNAVELEVKGNGTFQWEPKELVDCPTCSQTVANVPGSSQLFRVRITDEFGCINGDQILVSKITNNLYVPNTFTPNSDTKNEVFKAYGFNLEDFHMMIYNRWGEKVFSASHIDFGWDGTFKGEPAEAGTYVWTIEYRIGDDIIEEKGSLTLLK